MNDQSFRVIAIKPLPGCDPNIRKTLKTNTTYFLFQDKKITPFDNLDGEPFLIREDFYSDNEPHIEINAIIGKNGSGKSTLIELLIMAINNFIHGFKTFTSEVKYINGLHVSVYFQLGERFYKLSIDDREAAIFRHDPVSKKMKRFRGLFIKQFFYTIVVNFSHYAYNSEDYSETQQWLPKIFKKNDGYQIPIVLNPYRDKGIIDINIENQLANVRIMANLLRPVRDSNFNYDRLTDRFSANHLKLKNRTIDDNYEMYNYRRNKDDEVVTVKFGELDIDKAELIKLLGSRWKIAVKKFEIPKFANAVNYIIYKLINICLNYPKVYGDYFQKSNKKFTPLRLKEYIGLVLADPSHISFKLKQTLNFIRFEHIDPARKKLDLKKFGRKIYEIKDAKYSPVKDIIELLPPPIFTPEIILLDETTKENIPFKLLSSGEKQWNYVMSSVLYHLINLNSVSRKDKRRHNYEKVLIILEEIELYFHPDMQRQYIHFLVKSIQNLRLENIKHIQVILVTHSPFILSDIPSQNALFLYEDGLPAGEKGIAKTFGGNLHELLAKNFFLNTALVGEFAKHKIQFVIDQLKPEAVDINAERRRELMDLILLIGEDFLRDKLLAMLKEKTKSLSKQEKIKILEEELKTLKDDKATTE